MHEPSGTSASHKPLIWTYLIEGLGVNWMSLTKVQLFMYEIVKRLGAHERGRLSFELSTDNAAQPACTVMCGIAESEISITTYPENNYARLMVCTMGNPDVDALSEAFAQFFSPKAQTEGYLESPTL